MNIEQRQVTTINLQDGKAREFVVSRDGPVCTISGVCGDEVMRVVMSSQDYQRLAHTFGQPVSHDGGVGTATGPGSYGAGEGTCGCGGRSGIQVERRQVTTVTLVPSRTRDFLLTQDERGYTLTSLAREEVVTLHLSVGDYHKLRYQVVPHSHRAVYREAAQETTRETPSYTHARPGNGTARAGLATLSAGSALSPNHGSVAERSHGEWGRTAAPSGGTCSPYMWTGIDWLSYN